jgi:acyl-CoA thioesterase I
MTSPRVVAAVAWIATVTCCSVTLAQSSSSSGATTPANQPAAAPPPCSPNPDWPNLARYQESNAALTAPTPDTPRVVFMGDSITQGWAEQRQAVFASNGYIGRGISGQTTSQMVLRFHQDIIALKPAVVAILAGTNDVAENTGPMTDAQILDNLAAMAEMARAHGIKVVVGSVPPATYFSWRREIVPTARIRDLNPKIKSWADAEHIVYADYWSAMALPDGGMNPAYAGDSVHPNADGYAVMESIVKAAIAAALKATR